ncbi:DUF4296 domain-containing protein [Fulvivirga lutimaris]|uniref:DUF4296 domain-containing protein n=1 Tax=Fulvivirga lutimaris TaxID=1819566 RepID=UPI0012BCA609|nr:DUF4296 domain-containing protein [Fulvivirga lutimaris]MTI38632.1 DUF4296 domain-containing protein [Fulvivirga lutimaris]
MKIFKIFLLSLVIVSCGKSDDVPEDVIPKEQLVPLMLDIYLAEVKLSNLQIVRDTAVSIFETYEGYLFEKHNIEKEQYMNSMTYYYDHTEELELIYEALLDTLTVRETKLKAIDDNKKAKLDSLKKNK